MLLELTDAHLKDSLGVKNPDHRCLGSLFPPGFVPVADPCLASPNGVVVLLPPRRRILEAIQDIQNCDAQDSGQFESSSASNAVAAAAAVMLSSAATPQQQARRGPATRSTGQSAHSMISDSLPFVSPTGSVADDVSPGGGAGLGMNFSFSDSFADSSDNF